MHQTFRVTPKSQSSSSGEGDDGPLVTTIAAIWGGGLVGTGLALSSLPTVLGGILLAVPLLASGSVIRALDGYATTIASIKPHEV